MTISHLISVRDTITNAVVDAIDLGGPNGTVVIETSANAEVATITLAATAFGSSASGKATAQPTTPDIDANGGIADHFNVNDGGAGLVFAGSVSLPAGGGDMELSSLTIPAGGTVNLNVFEYTGPA